jgi:hypothetical protein
MDDRMETAEMRFVRMAAGYRMTDHKRNIYIREEMRITKQYSKEIIKISDWNKWKERLKTESRSCSANINRSVDVRYIMPILCWTLSIV